MENIVKRLQDEAGLTEEQAIKALAVVKDFMDKEGLSIDWSKFFKNKYEDLTDNLKDLYKKLTGQSQGYTEKISDTVDNLTSKVRKGAHDISQKAADFFDDKKD